MHAIGTDSIAFHCDRLGLELAPGGNIRNPHLSTALTSAIEARIRSVRARRAV